LGVDQLSEILPIPALLGEGHCSESLGPFEPNWRIFDQLPAFTADLDIIPFRLPEIHINFVLIRWVVYPN
jgi:hypothetical protein